MIFGTLRIGFNADFVVLVVVRSRLAEIGRIFIVLGELGGLGGLADFFKKSANRPKTPNTSKFLTNPRKEVHHHPIIVLLVPWTKNVKDPETISRQRRY